MVYMSLINYKISIILVFSFDQKLRSYRPASGVQSGQEHTKQEVDAVGASGGMSRMKTSQYEG